MVHNYHNVLTHGGSPLVSRTTIMDKGTKRKGTDTTGQSEPLKKPPHCNLHTICIENGPFISLGNSKGESSANLMFFYIISVTGGLSNLWIQLIERKRGVRPHTFSL